MAIRFKKSGPRRRHFAANWRRYRELSQERLGELLGITAPTLSRIENGVIPYSQDFVEACAEALRCTPADIVGRDPLSLDDLLFVWDRVPPAERPRALEVLRAFTAPPPVTEEPALPRRAQGGRQ